jgi:heptosyltransferase-2
VTIIKKDINKILVRGTNWVGDALMTLPALAAVRSNFPGAKIHVLAKPWVAPIYSEHPAVDRVVVMNRDAEHRGMMGLWRLTRELRREYYDLAVLFQNAFQAALIAVMAGIPQRLGYNTDARGILLNRSIRLRLDDKKVHETEYYLRILERAGLEAPYSPPIFQPSEQALRSARNTLEGLRLIGSFLLGIAPGAAFGTAKQWPAQRFAQAADAVLAKTGGTALLFGSPKEAEVTARVKTAMTQPAVDLAGKTDLAAAAALIQRCQIFLTNDSGLMHLAAAVDVPLVAVFGSTNPVTTSPVSQKARLIRHQVDCSPCLKPHCDRETHQCMDLVTSDEVARAALDLLKIKDNDA